MAFGLGKLTDAETEVIARHLTACEDCRRLVEGVAPDSLVGLVRSARQATVLPATGPAASPSLAGAGLSQMAGNAEPPLPPVDLPPELADHARYRILRVLGEGGMGVVYEAEHRHMGRKVALKVISKNLVDRPEAVERFTREVKAAARLNHPNIVTAYDAEQAGSLHLLVMEYVEGMSLAQVVERKGPLPVAHACHFVRQALLGLQHAFEQGMVHRDLKPHNLMVTSKGLVKILDFGLARLASEQSRGPGLTAADAIMGTPEYLAPEQALDARQADIRADIYSPGCTLYCLLAGQPPFPEGTAMQKVMAHLEKQPRPLPELRPDVRSDLWTVVARMLARDLTQRYQKPIEVAQALVPFIKPGAKRSEGTVAAPLPGVSSPRTGTVLGGDTSKVLKLRKNAATEPPAKAEAAPFQDRAAAVVSPAKAKQARAAAKPGPAVWYRRPPVLAGVTSAVLVLSLGAWLLAGVIFKTKVKTPDGEAVVVLEINPPGAEVLVDGQQLTVHVPGESQPIEIKVEPGPHQFVIRKEGFRAVTREIEIPTGKAETIKVWLEPKKPVNTATGFVPLFNGKDLTGWKSLAASKATWEVKDGVLIGSGGRGYLFNDPTCYENFHLRVEAMINDGGNSGVYFRAPFGPTTPQGHPAFGNEAQINITHQDPHKTGSLYVANKVAVGLPKTPTELAQWFTLEVIADGQHLVVKVNGKVTADYIELAVGSRSGRIALQVLDAATVVKFRRIEIKELPPGDLRLQYPHGQGVFEQVKGNVWLERRGNWLGYFREHHRDNVQDGGGTVRLNRKIENNKTGVLHLTRGNGAWWNVQGTPRWTKIFMGGWSVLPRTSPPEKSSAVRIGEWTPLLNGKDLSGWKAAGTENATWTYEGDALVGQGRADRAGLLLTDRADYENFHLRMETQLSEGAFSSLFFRCGPPSDGTAGNKCYAIRIGAASAASPVTGTLVLSAHLDEAVPLGLADAAKVPLKAGEWFPLEVIAEGNRLRVLVSGKTVVDHTDANATFTTGRLGLVCRPNALVRFRKLEIKELPSGKP
jgi:hypothetical protein